MKQALLVVAILVVGCSEDDAAAPFVCLPETRAEAAECAWELACPTDVASACVDYVDGGATEWEGTRAERIGACVSEWCAEASSVPQDASEQ